MKKVKRTQPRRLLIQLNISPHQINCQQNNEQKINNKISAPEKSKTRFITKGSYFEDIQKSKQKENIIRLKSKKKMLRSEFKENIQEIRVKTDIKKSHEKKNSSLDKYFESARAYKILQFSHIQAKSFDTQNPQAKSKLKTEYDNNCIKRAQLSKSKTKQEISRRRLSGSQSTKTLFIKKQTKADRSCSLNKKIQNTSDKKKLQQRLQRVKKYGFVQQYLSDLELEGIFNQLEFAKIPQPRWTLIIVDKVYQIIRRRELSNDPDSQIIRKF